MFNLRYHKQFGNAGQRLEQELSVFGIQKTPDGQFLVSFCHPPSLCPSIQQILSYAEAELSTLQKELSSRRAYLMLTVDSLLTGQSVNHGSLDNTLFLYFVKRAILTAMRFSDVELTTSLQRILYVDINSISLEQIQQFNKAFLSYKSGWRRIVRNRYRKMLLESYRQLYKLSSTMSGPANNLDLEESERFWLWAEDEEYFESRTKARRNQPRYHPEYNQDDDGFHFKWYDQNRDPYKWEDREEESPYPSRSYMQIP